MVVNLKRRHRAIACAHDTPSLTMGLSKEDVGIYLHSRQDTKTFGFAIGDV